jgi:hypothetical protein
MSTEPSPANAASVIARILDSIDNTLAFFPFMGRAGAVAGTREWAVPGLPYLAVYEVVGDREALVLRAVMHMAQHR